MHNMTQHDLLCHLYALGFWRAVVLHSVHVSPHIVKVTFQNQTVVMAPQEQRAPRPTFWPPRQHGPRGGHPFFTQEAPFESNQLVKTGFTMQDIHDLFESQHDLLRSDLEDLDLPDEIKQAVASCDPSIPNEELDRLLVYADGSSLGTLRQTPPLRAEEEGKGDT